MRQFAISDIHGCNRTFIALLEKLTIGEGDKLFLLGDYIDRGPDSKGVLVTIQSLIEKGIPVISLLGNHEEMLLNSFANRQMHHMWLSNGGLDTLSSFHTDSIAGIEDRFLDFMNALEHYHESGKYIFVHAGLNFDHLDPFDNLRSMLWIRSWYEDIDWNWLGDRYIIHGHTPVDRQEIERALDNLEEKRVLNIDNGCFRAAEPGKGHLCALDLDKRELHFQKNIDMTKPWRSF